MRSLRVFLIASVVCSLLTGGLAFRGQGSLYSRDQIDQMVAPIALYPDALMSQVLMAATYPEQVADADQWVRANPGLTGSELDDALATATWDPSVIALCKFPTVLDKMAGNIKWTSDLGSAFLNQKADVMDAVQSLRQAAYQSGHLRTTPQQRVVVQPQTIVIEPYAPDVIYVPAYQPAVVYGPVWSYPAYYYPAVWAPAPGVSFVNGFFWGVGFAFGNVLFGGCDWYHHDVYVNNTVIVNNRIYRNTPYYRGGYWHGHYGHQPWNHHYGRIDYARVQSGAPYGGRSHGQIRGVDRRPGALHAERMDRTNGRRPSAIPDRRGNRSTAHGPTGYRESRGTRPATRGPAGYADRRPNRPAAHGPTGTWQGRGPRPSAGRPTGRYDRGNRAPAGVPSRYSEYGGHRPAAHGPTGYTRPANERPAYRAPASRPSRTYSPGLNRESAGNRVYRESRPSERAPARYAPRSAGRQGGRAPAASRGGHGQHKRR